jgi:hypothetical protein
MTMSLYKHLKLNDEELNILILLLKREILEYELRPSHFGIDTMIDLYEKLLTGWNEDV